MCVSRVMVWVFGTAFNTVLWADEPHTHDWNMHLGMAAPSIFCFVLVSNGSSLKAVNTLMVRGSSHSAFESPEACSHQNAHPR